MSGRRRIPIREGDVVEIALGNGFRSFGRVLVGPLEFYELHVAADEQVSIDEIVSAPVAFRVWVMDYAVARGHWPIVGTAPLSAAEKRQTHRFFKQDPLDGTLTIYWEDAGTGSVHELPASHDDVAGLECAAVWDPEHVEDRLRDYFAGRPNKWVESLRAR